MSLQPQLITFPSPSRGSFITFCYCSLSFQSLWVREVPWRQQVTWSPGASDQNLFHIRQTILTDAADYRASSAILVGHVSDVAELARKSTCLFHSQIHTPPFSPPSLTSPIPILTSYSRVAFSQFRDITKLFLSPTVLSFASLLYVSPVWFSNASSSTVQRLQRLQNESAQCSSCQTLPHWHASITWPELSSLNTLCMPSPPLARVPAPYGKPYCLDFGHLSDTCWLMVSFLLTGIEVHFGLSTQTPPTSEGESLLSRPTRVVLSQSFAQASVCFSWTIEPELARLIAFSARTAGFRNRLLLSSSPVLQISPFCHP